MIHGYTDIKKEVTSFMKIETGKINATSDSTQYYVRSGALSRHF